MAVRLQPRPFVEPAARRRPLPSPLAAVDMSALDRATSLSGTKRAASATNAVAQTPAQRMRLSATAAAAANPLAAVRPRLSPAQSCAADTLTLVFGFVELKEMTRAARTCKAWLATAAKEKPRGLSWTFWRAERLAAVCTSSSPLKRHIARVVCRRSSCLLSPTQLAQLRQLPELTALSARLSAMDLKRLMEDEEGGRALAELMAAFPPRLRRLTLVLPKARTAALWQLLLDALPAMKGLEQLSLTPAVDIEPSHSAEMSLEPLLQLPRLTHLERDLGRLTVSQLRIIQQISTLQSFSLGVARWSAAQLSALCRPPHRLQQLQEVDLRWTDINEAAMAELICLPALTTLQPDSLAPSAIAFLPRLPRLQRLRLCLGSIAYAASREAEKSALVSALSACEALTHLTLAYGECTESFGDQLISMEAVPRLRSLVIYSCSLPSLRFLAHAPNLKKLCLLGCKDVRPGHVVDVGAFAPQLQRLRVEDCPGLQLDDAEERMLTPPGALGLPRIHEFDYGNLSSAV